MTNENYTMQELRGMDEGDMANYEPKKKEKDCKHEYWQPIELDGNLNECCKCGIYQEKYIKQLEAQNKKYREVLEYLQRLTYGRESMRKLNAICSESLEGKE